MINTYYYTTGVLDEWKNIRIKPYFDVDDILELVGAKACSRKFSN